MVLMLLEAGAEINDINDRIEIESEPGDHLEDFPWRKRELLSDDGDDDGDDEEFST